MKNFNFKNNTKDILLPSEEVRKILMHNYYQKSMQDIKNMGVDINHLENIFTDEAYYLAMKIVPALEKKILYLTYIENVRLNDICRRLKLGKKEVITLRNKATKHFKHNLEILYRVKMVIDNDER